MVDDQDRDSLFGDIQRDPLREFPANPFDEDIIQSEETG